MSILTVSDPDVFARVYDACACDSPINRVDHAAHITNTVVRAVRAGVPPHKRTTDGPTVRPLRRPRSKSRTAAPSDKTKAAVPTKGV